MATRVNVLTQRKDYFRKQEPEIPLRASDSERVDLPGVLLEDLGDRMLEAGHDVTPA